MVENDTKGWYGSFSIAGKESAEKYGIPRKPDKFDEKIKKKFFKDFLSPDDNYKFKDEEEYEERKIDLFKFNAENKEIKKVENKNDKIIIFQNIENLIKNKLKMKKERYKYHNKNKIRMEKKRKEKEEKNKYNEEGPSLSKYTPKMEYIWSRSLSGPKWESLSSRKFKYLDNNWEISNNQKSFINESKCVVNMKKQTMRYGFPITHDLRIRYEKKYSPPKKKKKYFVKNIQKMNNTPNVTPRKKISIFKTNLSQKNYHSILNNKVKLIPDFKKTMSRSKIDRIKNKRENLESNLIPNYSFIQERPIMMVIYDKKLYKKKNTEFKGMDSSILYNIDKVYYKYNNHKKISVPLFKDMISRSNSNLSPLPSYMKGIYSRISSFSINDKSLEMNNYSQGQFFNGYNSFYPKKSFNKLINLNLLNSDNTNIKNYHGKRNNSMLNKYFNRTIDFYKNNYDDLIHQSMLKKFDNVTYKTIDKKYNYSQRDMKYKHFTEIEDFFFE